jgi:hypothetical protein
MTTRPDAICGEVQVINRLEWHRWFAWRPVRTLGGRLVWWKFVDRRWDMDGGYWHDDFSGYTQPSGGWEYRLPLVWWQPPGSRWWRTAS